MELKTSDITTEDIIMLTAKHFLKEEIEKGYTPVFFKKRNEAGHSDDGETQSDQFSYDEDNETLEEFLRRTQADMAAPEVGPQSTTTSELHPLFNSLSLNSDHDTFVPEINTPYFSSPQTHQQEGYKSLFGPSQKIYFEKHISPNDMTLTAFAKDLPDSPHPNLYEITNMFVVDEIIKARKAYFFRAEEQLSLLVAWGGEYQNDSCFSGYPAFGHVDADQLRHLEEALVESARGSRVSPFSPSFLRLESSKNRWTPTATNTSATTKKEKTSRNIEKVHHTSFHPKPAMKLALSHPAIRKLSVCEIGIIYPLKREFTDHSDSAMNHRTEELQACLSTLVQDLSSFSNLRNIRLVLIGWGWGQSFRKGGGGAESILPFFELLESGVSLSIQLQVGGVSVSEDLVVTDLRRRMNDSEVWDFRGAFDAHYRGLGKKALDVVFRGKDDTSLLSISKRK